MFKRYHIKTAAIHVLAGAVMATAPLAAGAMEDPIRHKTIDVEMPGAHTDSRRYSTTYIPKVGDVRVIIQKPLPSGMSGAGNYPKVSDLDA